MRGPVGTWSLPFESVAQDVCGEAQSLTLQPSALDRICTNLLLCKCNFVLKACSFAHGTPNMHTSSFPIRPSLHPSIHPVKFHRHCACGCWIVSPLSHVCPLVQLSFSCARPLYCFPLENCLRLKAYGYIQHTLC